MMISDRVKSTQIPPLVELGQFANSQQDCISLGQGAPFYKPPPEIFTDLSAALIQHSIHRYTADPGLLELRELLTEKLRYDQHISTNINQIVITPGANQAFYNILVTITDPGDEIILLTPYYFNHYMACSLINVQAVCVPLSNDLSFNIEKIKNSISDKTKAIVLVNPGNPTGKIHTLQEIKELIDVASTHNLVIIADETYEYFVYEGKHHPVGSLTDNVISISSFSKTFGIPGWRLGYYVATEEIIQASLKVQDTIGICAPHSSQYLGITLLKQRHQLINEFVNLMKANYNVAKDLLEEISWLQASPSGGAYYLFPKQLTNQITEKLVRELIVHQGVYIVPGAGFGSDWQDYCRLSFANVSEEQLKEAFSRLRSYS